MRSSLTVIGLSKLFMSGIMEPEFGCDSPEPPTHEQWSSTITAMKHLAEVYHTEVRTYSFAQTMSLKKQMDELYVSRDRLKAIIWSVDSLTGSALRKLDVRVDLVDEITGERLTINPWNEGKYFILVEWYKHGSIDDMSNPMMAGNVDIGLASYVMSMHHLNNRYEGIPLTSDDSQSCKCPEILFSGMFPINEKVRVIVLASLLGTNIKSALR